MRPSSRGLLGNAAGGQIGANVFCMEHSLFSRGGGKSAGFCASPELEFRPTGVRVVSLRCCALLCHIYMRESVETMYIYVAVREHLAFVRVRSIL